jgi:hypothetical protein
MILEKLKRYPELSYRISGDTITVDPPSSDGFAVSFCDNSTSIVVGFDAWHEHFSSEEEALNCFAFGLSNRCRLQIQYRGSYPHRWTLQEWTEKGWRDYGRVGLFLFPFWRHPRLEYRQNSVIEWK